MNGRFELAPGMDSPTNGFDYADTVAFGAMVKITEAPANVMSSPVTTTGTPPDFDASENDS